MKIAIMQPYFIPYAGYFRLFAATDLFIAYDCVQFPRRGWVHRNRLTDANGNLNWLTLPINKTNRDTTRICDLTFQPNAQHIFNANCQRFPSLSEIHNKYPNISSELLSLGDDATGYFIAMLKSINELLGFKQPIIRSSSLNIDPELKGQKRILEIATHFDATTYINAPGGKELYDKKHFFEKGIKLHFLKEYSGSYTSILERLSKEPLESLIEEINSNLSIDPT